MAQVEEIPQQIPSIALPQIWKPDYNPVLAQQEALQDPDIDPVMAMSMAIAGGIPGLFSRFAGNTALQTALAPLSEPGIMPPPVRPPGQPTGILPVLQYGPNTTGFQPTDATWAARWPTQSMTSGAAIPPPNPNQLPYLPPPRAGLPYGEQIGDRLEPDPTPYDINPPPGGMIPGYYTPDVRARAEGAGRLFSQPKTTPLYDVYGSQTNILRPEEYEESRGGEPYPPYHYLPEEVSSQFRMPEGGPPPPESLLWHGLSLYERPEDNIRALKSLQQGSYGLEGGWFANAPVGHFGPFFVGARPEDLPPMETVPKWMREDPAVQLSPKWKFSERPQIGLEPISRYERIKLGKTLPPGATKLAGSYREVPDISIHPSKLHVIDKHGNYYGTVGESRIGGATAPFTEGDIESMFTKFGKVLKDLPEE